MWKCCSGLESKEKPPANAYHHEVVQYYQTLSHSCFTQETPFNIIYTWKRDFYAEFYRTFSFVVSFPFSRYFFTHHVDPIIKEVEYDVEVASDFMVVQVYDPPLSRAYVHPLKVELVKTRQALAHALKDYAHAEKEAHRWSLNGDDFYRKAIGWKPHRPPMPLGSLVHLSINFEDSGDEFLRNLDEEVVKQKEEKM